MDGACVYWLKHAVFWGGFSFSFLWWLLLFLYHLENRMIPMLAFSWWSMLVELAPVYYHSKADAYMNEGWLHWHLLSQNQTIEIRALSWNDVNSIANFYIKEITHWFTAQYLDKFCIVYLDNLNSARPILSQPYHHETISTQHIGIGWVHFLHLSDITKEKCI